MESGGFFPFGGDPEEILQGLRDFAETQRPRKTVDPG